MNHFKPQIGITKKDNNHYIVVKTYKNDKCVTKSFGNAKYWDNWGSAYDCYIKLVNIHYLNKYRNMAKKYVGDIDVNAIMEITEDK